ncbi:hypothetical protein H5410_039776 [Solanum commersonii]|uniref:Uncharacterized protein n=1 Tax=Solanum commersonii TaxID=4109 RepID=A0A9J5XQL2_SOLCO|nr:hypothetical protein H5410_039776 [Solanum commersonii]
MIPKFEKSIKYYTKLPELEVLKFKAVKLLGNELGETAWEVSEMGFPKLKFLLIEKKGMQMKMRRGETELNVTTLEADESRLLFVKNAGDDANFCCKDSHSGVTKQMMEIPVQESTKFQAKKK